MKKLLLLSSLVSLFMTGSAFAGEVSSLPGTPVRLICGGLNAPTSLNLFFDWQDLISGQVSIAGQITPAVPDNVQPDVQDKNNLVVITTPDNKSIVLVNKLTRALVIDANGIVEADLSCNIND